VSIVSRKDLASCHGGGISLLIWLEPGHVRVERDYLRRHPFPSVSSSRELALTLPRFVSQSAPSARRLQYRFMFNLLLNVCCEPPYGRIVASSVFVPGSGNWMNLAKDRIRDSSLSWGNRIPSFLRKQTSILQRSNPISKYTNSNAKLKVERG